MSIVQITFEIENYFELTRGILQSPHRPKTVAFARAIAMFMHRKYCKRSFPEIGYFFNRDHSTAIYNCRKIGKLLKTESHEARIAINAILHVSSVLNFDFMKREEVIL
jgi:chromosomal replication initiation ATPase DnaA